MENSINIGELDTIVLIQKCILTHGSQGQKEQIWQDHSRVYAKVERNINEMVSNNNLEENNILELTCYKIAGLTIDWRIIVDGQPHQITGVNPISRVSPLCIISLKAID